MKLNGLPGPPAFDRFKSFGNDDLTAKHVILDAYCAINCVLIEHPSKWSTFNNRTKFAITCDRIYRNHPKLHKSQFIAER